MRRGYLAVITMLKNEARYVGEWLAFHAACGVEHFFIYDNDSTDGTAERIGAFPFPEMVTLVPWPGHKVHLQAKAHGIFNFGPAWRWMAFIDSDEFLFSTEKADLRDFLREFERRPALGVHWLCYGSSGLRTPPERLQIEAFVNRSTPDFVPNRHVKSIFQPRFVSGRGENTHIVDVNGTYVREDDRPVTWQIPGFTSDPPLVSRIRINHYFVRSREDWERKVARGRSDDDGLRPMDMFDDFDRNDVRDESALRYRQLMRPYL